MNDVELAEAVIGILGSDRLVDGEQPFVLQGNGTWMGVVPYVRDWRVAGALMERLDASDRGRYGTEIYLEHNMRKIAICFHNESEGIHIDSVISLPRAIIEACVTALVRSQAEI